jgi:hypothetical protein
MRPRVSAVSIRELASTFRLISRVPVIWSDDRVFQLDYFALAVSATARYPALSVGIRESRTQRRFGASIDGIMTHRVPSAISVAFRNNCMTQM